MEKSGKDFTLTSRRPLPPGRGYCAAIGFFDGVHIGHRFLLRQVADAAARCGLGRMAITFDRHPRCTLQPSFRPALLTTPEEKTALLLDGGADMCAVLRFSAAMAALSARDFMERYLSEQLGVRCLVVGYDHRFGSNPADSFSDYVDYGRRCGIEVVRAEVLESSGFIASSSLVRRALQSGDVQAARQALGRPYVLSGTVVEGRHVGRSLGFPTANLRPAHPDKLVPAGGVYAVRARVGERTYDAMLNIGSRPTLHNGDDATIEAHIFGFDGNLYGQSLTLSFEHRLRAEQAFASLDQLRDQLFRDAAQARILLASPC